MNFWKENKKKNRQEVFGFSNDNQEICKRFIINRLRKSKNTCQCISNFMLIQFEMHWHEIRIA